jgi:hypothetical protein
MDLQKAKRSERYASIAVWLMAGGFAAFALSIGAYTLSLSQQGLSNRSGDWGTFGDFIGGMAGTLIAFMTLVAIAFTLHLQARELEETRAELEKQTTATERQAFEATFFRLLANRQDTLKDVRWGQRMGRRALHHIATECANQFVAPVGDALGEAQVARTVDNVFNQFRAELDPLVGSTMQLLRFAASAKAPSGAVNCREIALADFSNADQVLFLFVGLSNYGKRYGAFDVVRDSGLLKQFAPNSFAVLIPQALLDRYEPQQQRG